MCECLRAYVSPERPSMASWNEGASPARNNYEGRSGFRTAEGVSGDPWIPNERPKAGRGERGRGTLATDRSLKHPKLQGASDRMT